MLFSMKNQCFEVKKYYDGSERKFPCQLLILENGFGIIKYVMENDFQLEHILLPKGTISLGFFWENRNYNVYQWYSGIKPIARYFNISDFPHLTKEKFIWTDWIIDILVDGNNEIKILDEDELASIKNNRILTTIERTKKEILQNLDKIITEIDSIVDQSIELI